MHPRMQLAQFQMATAACSVLSLARWDLEGTARATRSTWQLQERDRESFSSSATFSLAGLIFPSRGPFRISGKHVF